MHGFYALIASLGEVDMSRVLRPILTLVMLGCATAAAAEELPRPAGLEPAVRFWLRVYTEVDSNGGLIHDSRNLDVVYELCAYELLERIFQDISNVRRQKLLEDVESDACGNTAAFWHAIVWHLGSIFIS